MACDSDVETYCSQVTPGEGRMLYCIAAHEDKISGQCVMAFYQAAAILEIVAHEIAHVANECEADIETHYDAVPAGEGRILECLEDNAEELSDACTRALTGDAAADKQPQ